MGPPPPPVVMGPGFSDGRPPLLDMPAVSFMQPLMSPRPHPRPSFNNPIFVRGIGVKSIHEFNKISSLFAEYHRLAKIECPSACSILWYKFCEVCVVADIDLVATANMRHDMSLLNNKKALTASCVKELSTICKQKKLSWKVSLLSKDYDDLCVRSNIIELLRKIEKHWSLWDMFKSEFFNE
jgi:hypothetical protein